MGGRPVALFGIGAILDCEKGMEDKIKSLEIPNMKKSKFKDFPNRKIIESLVMEDSAWWRNLPKNKLGFDIIKLIDELVYNIEILTVKKNGSNHISNEIENCLRDHFGKQYSKIEIIPTDRLYSSCEKEILIDTSKENINYWLKYSKSPLVIPSKTFIAFEEIEKEIDGCRAIYYNGVNLEQIKDFMKNKIQPKFS